MLGIAFNNNHCAFAKQSLRLLERHEESEKAALLYVAAGAAWRDYFEEYGLAETLAT